MSILGKRNQPSSPPWMKKIKMRLLGPRGEYRYYLYGLVKCEHDFPPVEFDETALAKLQACDSPALRDPYIARLGQRLNYIYQVDKDTFQSIYPLEQLRMNQREAAKGQTSVILFACQAHGWESLQNTLLPYYACARALYMANANIPSFDKYRIIICNSIATEQSMKDFAPRSIHGINITYESNISNIDDLINVINGIGDDEKLALAYISSHGEPEGLYGVWDGSNVPSTLTPEDMNPLFDAIREKRSADAQIFFNACHSNDVVAKEAAMRITNMVVIGANEAIPTGSIYHSFVPDVTNKRLYMSFSCKEVGSCELFAQYSETGQPASSTEPEIIDLTMLRF